MKWDDHIKKIKDLRSVNVKLGSQSFKFVIPLIFKQPPFYGPKYVLLYFLFPTSTMVLGECLIWTGDVTISHYNILYSPSLICLDLNPFKVINPSINPNLCHHFACLKSIKIQHVLRWSNHHFQPSALGFCRPPWRHGEESFVQLGTAIFWGGFSGCLG